MNGVAVLIPVALLLGLLGLAAFFWAARGGQFEDLDGAALRILIDDEDRPDEIFRLAQPEKLRAHAVFQRRQPEVEQGAQHGRRRFSWRRRRWRG